MHFNHFLELNAEMDVLCVLVSSGSDVLYFLHATAEWNAARDTEESSEITTVKAGELLYLMKTFLELIQR